MNRPAPRVKSAPWPRWPAPLRALLALACGFLLVHAAVYLLARAGALPSHASPWAWAALVGAASVIAGARLRLEAWWLAMLALFPGAAWAVATLELPRWLWPALLLATVAVYWSTFSTRVPLYLSGTKARAAVLALLPRPGAPCRCIDLGSGLGGVTLFLAAARPDGAFTGVELAPLPALVGWLRARLARLPNARLARASLWDQPLGGYDLAYAFLSPVPMPALWEKATREMRPGSVLVSNSFAVPGVEAERVIEVDDLRGTRLYVYVMGPVAVSRAPCAASR